MSIERMKTLWLFAPGGRTREILDRLAGLGLSHLTDCGLTASEELRALGIQRAYPEAADIERRVHLLRETLETLSAFHRTSREFLANFIATPMEVCAAEVRQALAGLDVEGLHAEVRALVREHAAKRASLDEARQREKALAPLAGLRLTIPGSEALRHTAAWVGTMSLAQFERLRQSGRLPAGCLLNLAGQVRRRAVAQVACLAADREAVAAILREFGFEVIPPEKQTMTLDEYLAQRRTDVRRLAQEVEELGSRLKALALECQRRVEVALGYWEERLAIAQAAVLVARSRRLTVLKGYVRARDLDRLRTALAHQMPEVVLVTRDPAPGEPVPVALRNPRLFAPAEFLVNMFGLPDYFTFDPTPVIFFSFLIFFGFCFGDVVYGALLVACGLALARKYREYPNLRHFFQLLALGGVTTMLVGVLTDAWLADLYRPDYLGSGNPLLAVRNALTPLDRSKPPVVTEQGTYYPARFDMAANALSVLLVALLMGFINQMLGIVMLIVRKVRERDYVAAVCDGGFWLLLLPGVVGWAVSTFIGAPPAVGRTALALAVVGALGLVLTQGRDQKSLLGKALVGVVSLYGVVGTYGITSFVGDTLSYSRLLALGLTTGIVGASFNMMANMSRSIPYIGLVAFIIVLVAGHGLNFFLSILGGFVHSARLTFVEFFGRFYQGGAPRFRPLGTWQGRLRVRDVETVWVD